MFSPVLLGCLMVLWDLWTGAVCDVLSERRTVLSGSPTVSTIPVTFHRLSRVSTTFCQFECSVSSLMFSNVLLSLSNIVRVFGFDHVDICHLPAKVYRGVL